MRIAFAAMALLLTASSVSAERKVVQPKEFPTGRPFSPGVWAGNVLHVAGQIGQDLKTGSIPDKFEDEVKLCLENIGIILKEAGLSHDDVVTVHVYLTDIGLFQRMNSVYTTFFKEPRPARTTVAVAGLAGNAKIEITVTALAKNAKN